jgi:hypothetical protein
MENIFYCNLCLSLFEPEEQSFKIKFTHYEIQNVFVVLSIVTHAGRQIMGLK